MFENRNPPVVAEPPAAEAESLAGAAGTAEAPAAIEPGTTSPAPDTVAAAVEAEGGDGETASESGDGEAAAVAAGESPAEPSKTGAKQGRDGARRRGKRGARRPGARAEEFVKPTPEELAGITSPRCARRSRPARRSAARSSAGTRAASTSSSTASPAFCPRSSMELGAPHEPAQYLDQDYLFRVLRVEEKGRRLVLSRAAMLREERRLQLEEMRRRRSSWATVRQGQGRLAPRFRRLRRPGRHRGADPRLRAQAARASRTRTRCSRSARRSRPRSSSSAQGRRARLALDAARSSPIRGTAPPSAGTPAGSSPARCCARASSAGSSSSRRESKGCSTRRSSPPGVKETTRRSPRAPRSKAGCASSTPTRKRVSLALRETPHGNPWEGVEQEVRRRREGRLGQDREARAVRRLHRASSRAHRPAADLRDGPAARRLGGQGVPDRARR